MSRDRLVQHHGARGRVEGWHAVFVEDRNNRFGVGWATCRKHGRHVFLFNQLARICRSEFGLELVSKRNQFYFLSANTAFCIDGVYRELCPIRRLLDASAHGAGKSGCVSDQDLYLQGRLGSVPPAVGCMPKIPFFYVFPFVVKFGHLLTVKVGKSYAGKSACLLQVAAASRCFNPTSGICRGSA